jgi:hypothetical protein
LGGAYLHALKSFERAQFLASTLKIGGAQFWMKYYYSTVCALPHANKKK